MRLFRCIESFSCYNLSTCLEVAVLKGQLFLVEDPFELPTRDGSWMPFFVEFEMMTRKA